MAENVAVTHFARYPGVDFLNRDCLKTLHQILDIKVAATSRPCWSAALHGQGAQYPALP